MCEFWSALVCRDGKIVFDGNDSSHEAALKKTKWKDDKLADRDFVRIEITPPAKLSDDLGEWKFKVDEEGTLPVWYVDSQEKHREAAYKALRAYLDEFNWPEVCDFVSSLQRINWMKPDGRPLKSWKLFEAETWDAARAAARDAARDAAWDAAGAAAWAAACRIVKDKLDRKHIKHVEARMQVWRKGYALLCDVDGTLFVYAKKTR